MIINVSFDQSASTLPAGFVACVDAAVTYYENMFSNNVTLNIRIGYGEKGGIPFFGPPAESSTSYATNLSYSQVASALAAVQAPGAAGLPATSPISGALTLTSAEEKALGLTAANGGASDGSIGFNPPLLSKFFYDPTHTLAVPTGDFDFMSLVEHEFAGLMGQLSTLGQGNFYSPLDLYRYSAPGTVQTTAGGAAYFSTDGGATGTASTFSTASGTNYGNWSTAVPNDAFDQNVADGTSYSLSTADFQMMQALGWTGTYRTDSQVTPAIAAAAAVSSFQGGQTAPAAVVDSAANVQASVAGLAAMAAAGALGSITFSDATSPSPTLTLTAAQFSADSAVLAKITTIFTLAVTGVSAANAASVATQAVSAVGSANSVALSVSDTGANVLSNLASLQTLAQNWEIGTLNVTDGVNLTVSIATYKADDRVFSLNGNYTATVTGAAVADLPNIFLRHGNILVSDTAADVQANLDEISTANMQYGIAVTLTDPTTPTFTLSGSDWNSRRDLFQNVIQSPYKLAITNAGAYEASTLAANTALSTISVQDTAYYVSYYLDSLQSLAANHQLTGVSLTDSGTLALTAAQLINDSAALALVGGTVSYSVSGATVANAASILATPHVSTIGISDSAADITAGLATLETLVNGGHVSAISISDYGAITLSAAQMTTYAAVLADLPSYYSLTITNVAAASAAATLANSHVGQISVTDSAANVAANLDALETEAAKISSITLTDSGTANLPITPTQASHDSWILTKIASPYKIAATTTTVAGAEALPTAAQIPVMVQDSAANVAAGLDQLQRLASNGELVSIALTDGGTPILAVSASQALDDSQALAALTGSFKLAATGVSVSLYESLASGGHFSSVSVSDSGANIGSAFDSLSSGAAAGVVTSIAVGPTGSPILTLGDSQLSTDAPALGILVGNYVLSVTGVPVAGIADLTANSHVTSLGVSDSAANIGSNLDNLESLLSSGRLLSLTVTDGGALSVSAAQMVSDAQVINDIAGNYHLAITDAPLSSLSAGVVSHASSISVSDTGANIASNLDTLQAYAAAGKLTSVAVTDSGTAALSVTAAQFSADATALGDLSGNYTLKIDAGNASNLTLAGIAGHASTVSFASPASDYAISVSTTGDTVTVTDTGTGRTSTDHLTGVTALQFGAQTDIVAQAPGSGGAVTTGNVTELYGAVFGRLPDVGGLKFYENTLGAAGSGLQLPQFAQWFLASPEYADNPAHDYAQSDAGDAQFITDSYNNLLGRAPEDGAVAFYQKVIQGYTQGLTPGTAAYQAAQNLGHAYVLTYFSASNEFLGDVSITAQNPSSSQHWLLLTNG